MITSREDLVARIAQLEADKERLAQKVVSLNAKLESAKAKLANWQD